MKAEKRPRHWAAEIAALPSIEQRREALKKVPPEFAEIVKTHLRNTFFINSYRSK
jgi:hypothetical protein